MRLVWLFLILFYFLSSASDELPNCEAKNIKAGSCCLDTTKTPPFYISDSILGEKAYVQPSKSSNSIKKYDLYVPKGTIVQVPVEFRNFKSSEGGLLPFKAISVPRPFLEKTVENAKPSRVTFTKMLQEIDGKTRIEKDEIGFINPKALRKANDFAFYVNEDAPAYTTPNRGVLNNKSIIPTIIDGEFKIKRCCENYFLYEKGLQTLCVDDYFFDIFETNGEKVEEISYEFLKCGALQNITAIPLENKFELEALTKFLLDSASSSGMFTRYGIDELEIVMSNEGIKLVKLPLDEMTGQGAFNTKPYNSDDKGGTDFFLKPKSMCGFMGLAKKFTNECQSIGCQVQFGDMYHEKQWGDHKSHESGECVDIRPFRKNHDDITRNEPWHEMMLNPDKTSTKKWIPNTMKRNPRYDREKTQQFIEMAIKEGATDIFFNDPEINKAHSSIINRKKIKPEDSSSVWDHWWEIRGNIYSDDPSHNDHIHLCFKEQNPNVCKQHSP